MMAEQDDIMSIFSGIIQLRKEGRSQEDAWYALEARIGELTQQDKVRLIAMLRGWEVGEGKNYKASRHDPFATHDLPDGLEELRSSMDNPNKNVIRRIAPAGQPEPKPAAVKACAKCGKLNPENEAYCYSCGTLLVQTGKTQQISEPQPGDSLETNSAFFGDGMVLYVQVRGAKQMIRIEPRTDEMIVGRKSPDSVMLPDIDLSSYQADVMGVSRLHAGIRRQADTLVLTDLGSLNHTHINGQRLHPHEVRVLHDGDELRFGQLVVRIYFRKE